MNVWSVLTVKSYLMSVQNIFRGALKIRELSKISMILTSYFGKYNVINLRELQREGSIRSVN